MGKVVAEFNVVGFSADQYHKVLNDLDAVSSVRKLLMVVRSLDLPDTG